MDAITRSLQVSLLYIFVFLSGVHTQPKCFLNQPDPSHKHHLYYNGNSLPIILEGSYHLTQNITNHLLQILLTEVIGYEWVEIQYQYDQSMNASAILERMSGCTISGCGDGSKAMIPRTMVNIEVPVITGFDEMKWTSTGHIADAGNVGIQGRLGWFMPTYIINSFWKNGIIADHWRFLLLEAATNFSMLDQLHLIRNLTMNKSNSNKHFCDTDYCLHGIFYGPGCTQSDNDTCAILLSSYPEIDQGALKSQVEYLKLPIKIAWIGHHLHNFVFNAIKKLQPVLFFARYPDIVTLPNYFTRITFPECIAPLQNFPSDCDFQDNQFKKYVWSRIKTNSPEAYHLISHLNFDSIVYSAFLSSYVIRKSAFRVACDWLIHNEVIWKKWIPENLSTKSTIHLLGLFPLTGHQWRQPGLVQGAELAAELINKDETILPDYNLNIIEVDSKCKPDIAMKEFIRYIRNYTSMSIAGVLGPACSDEAEPIAALSRHFHMVTISYGAEASSLSDRMNYPYFYRTIPQVDHHKYVYEKFLDAMGWYHVGAIAEAGQELPEYHLSLQDYLQHHGISVVVKRNIKYGPKNTLDVSQLFADLRAQNVRVIIADFYDRAARAIMCEAYRQRMTAHEGYIWFLPSWYSPDWWDVGFHNNQINYGSDEPKEDVPCTTKNMAYAVNGHFVLSKTFSDSYKTLVAGDITVGRYKELYAEKVGKAEINGSPYANYVYDAVWTYAFALNKLVNSVPGAMETLHTKSTTDAFIKLINKTDFPGVTGRVRFEGSDRPGSLNILQFLHNGSRIVGKYTPGKKLGKGELEIYKSAITWMTSDGRKPTDGYLEPSQCVIENFRTLFGTTCEMAIVIANVIGFGIFVIFFVFVMVFIKFRYDAKVRVQHNRMKELGLSPSEFSQCFSLDDWEILRDNVVLNRKLGEGAFGTVYGGEVFMGEERWVAVAVKTLKIGSRFEEKIDFLSEAEIMKRFNHPNIVQLLGVCTRGEPVYAIMQYHLHGDLKTYLLSRRNLVGSDTKEAEDVSPRRLTQMALDISSGLKYIHDLKYVHRDVACRNCLVHSSQTVKIGDFGMTRPIIESDYYRFTKKGMLPVRWMSPESLWDGLFTTKSDVWSFGVLIYEIVTFGSFPYQGLSNNQVMEYVKSGSRFILPGNCSEDLCTFIYSCLAYEPNDRPDMEDIIDQLMKSPEFLIPCLDAPTTSVVIEDSDSLDIMSASCQNTITKSSNCTTLLNRLSQTSQDIKRFSGGSQGGGKSSTPTKLSIKTFVPALLSRPRSNSLGTTTPQSSQRESRYDQFYEIQDESPNFSFSIDKSKRHSDEIPGNASFMRCIPLLSPSEKGDATSDYFSDNSKELCQNLTFEMCQTVTSL